MVEDQQKAKRNYHSEILIKTESKKQRMSIVGEAHSEVQTGFLMASKESLHRFISSFADRSDEFR